MRSQLAEDAGLAEAEIRKLTPQEAHDILNKIGGGSKTAARTTVGTTGASSSKSTNASSITKKSRHVKKERASLSKKQAAAGGAAGGAEGGAAPPTSMAGPALGGIFGGGVALFGAAYYFFSGDDKDSPLNAVVQMIRGNEEEQSSNADVESSEMSLEEYERMQVANQNDFTKRLDEIKELSTNDKSAEAPWKDPTSNGNSSSSSSSTSQPKREMTMLEKLEEAKRRGNNAGISTQKLKRLPPQKPGEFLCS